MSSLWCHPKAQIHLLDNFLIHLYQNKHHVSVISAGFHMHKHTHLVMEVWEITPLNNLAR